MYEANVVSRLFRHLAADTVK